MQRLCFIMPFHFQAISPTSQERLLKAMDSLELQDNDYHSKCMHYHVWICGNFMFMPMSSLQSGLDYDDTVLARVCQILKIRTY